MKGQGWCDYFDCEGELLWTRKFTARTEEEAIEGCRRNLQYYGAVEGMMYWDGRTIARIR